METKELIGRIITYILVWSELEVGGFDKAEVFIELDNDKIIGIPWDFESENIERQPRKDFKRLFSDLSDISEYHITPEGKTIEEVLDAKKKRESSILGRLKRSIGISEGMPSEYKPYKIEFNENKLMYIRNRKIVDFLMFDDSDSEGFLELENGFIITETIISPNGTGMVGLNYHENISEFENRNGTDYKRLKNKSQ